MPRVCLLCGVGRACRSRRKYCKKCYDRHIYGLREFDLPAGHPFTLERAARVERMRQRAAQGLPIFEVVTPDLR